MGAKPSVFQSFGNVFECQSFRDRHHVVDDLSLGQDLKHPPRGERGFQDILPTLYGAIFTDELRPETKWLNTCQYAFGNKHLRCLLEGTARRDKDPSRGR